MLYSSSLFSLPAGAGAVIPVSEGSHGGHCWPVVGCCTPQDHRASPGYVTAFILSNGICWMGGVWIPKGSQGLRYLAFMQQSSRGCSNLCVSDYTKETQMSEAEEGNIQEFTPLVVRDLSAAAGPAELDSIWNSGRVSGEGELGAAQAKEKILDASGHCWIQCWVSRPSS